MDPYEVWVVTHEKGGVGKTTTTLNLGAELAAKGKRVVVIDLDPSGDLSTRLGMQAESEEQSLYGALVKKLPIIEILQPTAYEGLFLLAGDRMTAAVNDTLHGKFPGVTMRAALDGLGVFAEAGQPIDYVIIDSKPGMESLGLECLAVSDRVIVPTLITAPSLEQLRSVFEQVEAVKHGLQRSLHVHIIRTSTSARADIVKANIEKELLAKYGSFVLKARIPESARIRESAQQRVPLRALMAERDRLNATDRRIEDQFRLLAEELLEIRREKAQ